MRRIDHCKLCPNPPFDRSINMPASSSIPPTRIAATVALALGLALASATGEARERAQGAQRPARPAATRSVTHRVERQRTDNGHVRHDTWTNENGQGATRTATVVNDKEAGTRSREVEMTLPNGRTRTTSDVITRTENGYTRDTSITNPNGATIQRDVDATWDPATRTWTRDVHVERTPAPKPVTPPGG
jgi:hypothetical protein